MCGHGRIRTGTASVYGVSLLEVFWHCVALIRARCQLSLAAWNDIFTQSIPVAIGRQCCYPISGGGGQERPVGARHVFADKLPQARLAKCLLERSERPLMRVSSAGRSVSVSLHAVCGVKFQFWRISWGQKKS